jgi:eukaryotic-like serine/threonine-protein kinase
VSSRACPTCQTPLPDDAAFCSNCGDATATQILGETPPDEGERGRPSASYELEPARLIRALGANWELGPLIGRGGYAEVFQVRDLRLKRDLAIKVLRPDLIVTQALLARFRREAEAVAALRHPQIVSVYDVGEAVGITYIVMPLIRGESLKTLLKRDGPMPVAEVVRIVTEAANALGAAHAAGIIHRDIKPENIMLEGPERRVLLMDFGIAKAVDASEGDLTGTGVIVGTPQYMSPEQASGDPAIDHRTDQYSLAVVAYQMASGRVPFDGETARAVMAKQLLEEPPRLTSVLKGAPAPFVAALHRAMQKSPERRYGSVQAFAAALAAPTLGPEHLSGERRRRWLPWLAVGLAAASVAAVAYREWRPMSGPIVPPAPVPATSPAPAPSPPPSPVPLSSPARTANSAPVSARAPAPPPAGRAAAGDSPTAVAAEAPSTDTTARAPAEPPPADCRTLFDRQSWGQAYDRCLAEARGGSPDAGRYLGVIVAGRRADPDGLAPDELTRYLEQAARNGDAQAQFRMGARYDAGVGTTKNPTLAAEMYLKAAQSGMTEAYPIIATKLEVGLGKPLNLAEAARWYEEAAKAGDLPSELKIAGWYALGRGVRKQEATAARWYERAAEQGSPAAMYEIGIRYLDGRGVEKSRETGLGWLRQAAAKGWEPAQRELARREG